MGTLLSQCPCPVPSAVSLGGFSWPPSCGPASLWRFSSRHSPWKVAQEEPRSLWGGPVAQGPHATHRGAAHGTDLHRGDPALSASSLRRRSARAQPRPHTCRDAGRRGRSGGLWLRWERQQGEAARHAGPTQPVYQAPGPFANGRSPPKAGVRTGPARVGGLDSVQPVLCLWSRGAGVPALSAGSPQVPPVKGRSHMPISFGAGGTPLSFLGTPPPAVVGPAHVHPHCLFPVGVLSLLLPGALRGRLPTHQKTQERPHPGAKCPLPGVPGTLRLGLIPFGGRPHSVDSPFQRMGCQGIQLNCAASTSNSTLSCPRKQPWAVLAVPHPRRPQAAFWLRVCLIWMVLARVPEGSLACIRLGTCSGLIFEEFPPLLPPSLVSPFPPGPPLPSLVCAPLCHPPGFAPHCPPVFLGLCSGDMGSCVAQPCHPGGSDLSLSGASPAGAILQHLPMTGMGPWGQGQPGSNALPFTPPHPPIRPYVPCPTRPGLFPQGH
ncbi:uncharacterized protein LOC115272350 [Suricata suricatta]|uniref:uncharacterized protein LOC115272350 n=1 Tax=Suricata suricatta TaxID=37032 RepID=UPI0011565CA1|nr:uncharacterized protein LOC115272350 [Suricata suricatta]